MDREVGVQAMRYLRASSFEPSSQAFDFVVAAEETL